jgi:ABC-type multidrug transport system fused ATPase/permease subunit
MIRIGRVRLPGLASAQAVGPERQSLRSRIWLLIGDQRKRVAAMGLLAILSAVAEAATLALIAQIAATIVKPSRARVHPSLFHIHAPTKTLILAAFIIAVVRVPLLQLPGTILPARIMAEVGARLRTSLFSHVTARGSCRRS